MLVSELSKSIDHYVIFSEVLSSDEDDLEEIDNEYLENLARMAVKNSAQQGVTMTAKIEDYDESDDVSQLVSMLLLIFVSQDDTFWNI